MIEEVESVESKECESVSNDALSFEEKLEIIHEIVDAMPDWKKNGWAIFADIT